MFKLGHVFVDTTYDEKFPLENLTKRHRALQGLEDKDVGWLVGFINLEYAKGFLYALQEVRPPQLTTPWL